MSKVVFVREIIKTMMTSFTMQNILSSTISIVLVNINHDQTNKQINQITKYCLTVLCSLCRIDRNREELHHQHHDRTAGPVQRRSRQRDQEVRPLPTDDKTQRRDPSTPIVVKNNYLFNIFRN
jgi:hypothetical protein